MSRPDPVFVDSSNMESVGYDPGTNELWVSFRNGKEYVYVDVPESTYQDLLSATSKGSYLNREIKPNYHFRDA